MDEQTNNEYGVKVAMLIADPKYKGAISEEEANELDASIFNYSYGSEEVGYKLTFHWAVDKHSDTVVKARFTYEGVPSGIEVNHMMALLFTQKTMAEISTINYPALERLLRDNPKIEALPSEENYAITFGVDAAKMASILNVKMETVWLFISGCTIRGASINQSRAGLSIASSQSTSCLVCLRKERTWRLCHETTKS